MKRGKVPCPKEGCNGMMKRGSTMCRKCSLARIKNEMRGYYTKNPKDVMPHFVHPRRRMPRFRHM